MNLNRAYQRALLEELAACYPDRADWFDRIKSMSTDTKTKYLANLSYLDEHGLVSSFDDSGLKFDLSSNPRITARGMDFLADDGGLSAILGVLTVKLHEDTLKELIGIRIDKSDLPALDKSRLLEQLKLLPADAIKHLSLKLIDAGLNHWSSALPVIEQFVHRVYG